MRLSPRAVATALVLVLAVAACGGDDAIVQPPGERAEPAIGGDPEREGDPESEDGEGEREGAGADGGCGPVENPPLQAGGHLVGDAEPPVPYSSTPPTSGWHSSGALDVRIHDHDDPLREPQQVSVLEAEGVVITYRELSAEDEQELAALVQERYDGRVALSPYAELEPGEVALTAWGTLQRCAGLDIDAVTAFVEEHIADEVVPGHQH